MNVDRKEFSSPMSEAEQKILQGNASLLYEGDESKGRIILSGMFSQPLGKGRRFWILHGGQEKNTTGDVSFLSPAHPLPQGILMMILK